MSGLHVLTNVGGETQLAGINLKTYEKGFEATLNPNLIHQEYGDVRTIPKNGGDTVEYTRVERLVPAASPVALTEGSAGNPRTMVVTAITETPNQYGEFIKLSDRSVKQGKPGFFKKCYEVLANLGGETFDLVQRNGIIAGSKILYAGGKAGTNEIDNTCKASLALFRKGKKYLMALHNKGYEGEYMVALVHTDTACELENDPDWVEKVKFSDPSRLMKGEIGIVDGIKYVKTSVGHVKASSGATTSISGVKSTNSTNVDVYCSLLLGEREAYGVIGLEGENTPETIFKDLGSAGSNDPMNQVATLAYVGYTKSKVINDEKMYRIEHACSN